MSDLTEFILARVAEDEGDARVAESYPEMWSGWMNGQVGGTFVGHNARWTPVRVLAQCEAVRRIVELHDEWPVLIQTEPTVERTPGDVTGFAFRATQEIAWATNREYVARFGTDPPATPMLRALAAVWADHPDYDPAWAVS